MLMQIFAKRFALQRILDGLFEANARHADRGNANVCAHKNVRFSKPIFREKSNQQKREHTHSFVIEIVHDNLEALIFSANQVCRRHWALLKVEERSARYVRCPHFQLAGAEAGRVALNHEHGHALLAASRARDGCSNEVILGKGKRERNQSEQRDHTLIEKAPDARHKCHS